MSEDPPFFTKVLLDNYIGMFIFFSANITGQWHNVTCFGILKVYKST